ncbi:hypothetical protein SAMD00079811_17950 [Scytonema sp. HK-05]|uniref:hypothetical protein n=1 Tax=Scytonema sp. HK-05 TaxID=1137095 RepID=UPI0009375017|nr:hypothetical protein [Scytonema sp. HK-05]OKH54341.1 hypothetical protein NIES2130_29105 [Scytonema sp. HK-05]BAY44199.1 hypothetical protein SAMD00079811_17950 [Scytonema sp. HK-05]
MKFKLVQFLTVCLVTVLVLSPELVVFSMVWERHMELVQTKSLACELNQSHTSEVGLTRTQEEKSEQDTSNVHSATNFVEQSLTNTKQYTIFKILQWFFLLLPIFLGTVVFLYDRYLIYRAAVFQQQVEMLERLWQGIEQ